MSTYEVKSTVIGNRDATPKVLTDALVQGRMKQVEGYVQTYGAADGVGSIYRMCQVPSNARVAQVELQADSLQTGCTLDVGVWYPTFIPVGAGLSAASASTVIGTTFFASAVACSAALALTVVTNESGLNTIAKQELPLWSAVGLSADPGVDLDVNIYVSGAVAAQGYIGLKVSYVD